MTTKKAQAQAALAKLIEKSVADRISTLPLASPAGRVTKSQVGSTAKARLHVQVQKAYAFGPAGHFDPLADGVRKTLTSIGVASGKELHPGEFSQDYVLALAEESTLLSFAGRIYGPGTYASELALPAFGNSTTQWLAEGQDAVTNDVATRNVLLKSFRAVSATKVSGTLLRVPGNVAEEGLGQQLMQDVGSDVDAALYMGSGAGNTPVGISAQVKAANKFAITAAGAKATAAEVDADLGKARQKVRAAKVKFTDKARWIMPSAELEYLRSLREAGSGSPFYPTLQGENPTLKGIKVIESENVQGVHLYEGSHIAVGVPHADPIKVSQLSNDELNDNFTVFSRTHCDAKLLHDSAGAVITGTSAKWAS